MMQRLRPSAAAAVVFAPRLYRALTIDLPLPLPEQRKRRHGAEPMPMLLPGAPDSGAG